MRHNAFHQRIRDDASPVLLGDHDAPDECQAYERTARALDEAHQCEDREARRAALVTPNE